jgi:hypothetical protein
LVRVQPGELFFQDRSSGQWPAAAAIYPPLRAGQLTTELYRDGVLVATAQRLQPTAGMSLRYP